MNLYHIKLTDNQKTALEHLFSQDITWNKTELEKAWHELRKQVWEAAQHVAIINALQDSGCNCKKPTEPAPKYAPCRMFKRGDMVSPCFWYDRPPVASAYCGDSTFMPKDGVYEVKEDERDSFVCISYHGKPVFVQACHIELVTPVEELKPYSVHESEVVNGFDIVREKMCVMTFPFGSKEAGYYRNRLAAKDAAEAERDRLNAEYRKEQG